MSGLFDQLGFRGGPHLSQILGTSSQQVWADRFRTLVMSDGCDLLDLIRVPAAVVYNKPPVGERYHIIDQTRRTSIVFERFDPVGDLGAYHLCERPEEVAPDLLTNLFDSVRRLPQGRCQIEWPVEGVQLLGDEMSWSGP